MKKHFIGAEFCQALQQATGGNVQEIDVPINQLVRNDLETFLHCVYLGNQKTQQSRIQFP